MKTFISLFSCGLAACFLRLASADAGPVGSLFAYGKNVSGLPLIYADGRSSGMDGLWFYQLTNGVTGVALLGYGHPKGVSAAVNVSCEYCTELLACVLR